MKTIYNEGKSGRLSARSRTSGPGSIVWLSGEAKILRGLTLFLVAPALFAATIVSSRSAGAAQDARERKIAYDFKPADGGAFRQKLLSAPSISGTHQTADARASVNVSELPQQARNEPAAARGLQPIVGRTGNADKSAAGAGNLEQRAPSNSRGAIAPADNTLPDPTVVVLPTPLDLQSSTDIPDFSMAAGDQFIVTANSQTVYIQDGAGNVLNSSTLSGFFANLGPNNVFGPQVQFDDMTDRYIIAALDGFQTSSSSLLLSVSDTGDPTTTWTSYRFNADPQGQSSAGALSSIGSDDDWIVLSMGMFQNAQPNAFESSTLFVLDKKDLFINKHLSITRFTDPGYLPCPTKGYDTTYPYVDLFTDWSGNSSGKGVIRHGILTNSSGEARYIPAGEFLSFPTTWDIFPPSGNLNLVQQLGSSSGIYGGDGRIANAVFRNNKWSWVHSVYRSAGGPEHIAIHHVDENAVTGATQDGLLEYPGYSFFSPSIAVSSSDDELIVYNGSSASTYPGSGFVFRHGGQSSFGSPIPLLKGTEPSLHLKNGINVGATTAATCPFSIDITAKDYHFSKAILGMSTGGEWRSVQVYSPKSAFLGGTIAADNGSMTGAVGAPQGSAPGQYIFGNLFPSGVVGGRTINGIQIFVPSIPGSVQPGDTLYINWGDVPSSGLNGAVLTKQPYTVGQQNQFVPVNLDRPIEVPDGHSFFASISGPGGYWLGVDTTLPHYNAANSSPDGHTFGLDPFNTMVRLTISPPCNSKLDQTVGDFAATGGRVNVVRGTANCKPLATAFADWIVVQTVNFNQVSMDFDVFYAATANTSSMPRIGTIEIGDETFVVRQAGANPLPPVTTTPNSASAGGPGFKMTVNSSGSSSDSMLTPAAAGFARTTTVAWNGEARTTTWISPTELSADITAADIATAGAAQVTVFDLAPGGGTSPPVTFTITTAGPDFSLSLDQPAVTAQAGTKARVNVTINRSGGFAGNVTVTPPGPQAGIKAKPPDPITTTDNSVSFKLKIGGSTPTGSYQVIFKGKDDSGRERDVTLTLVVQ